METILVIVLIVQFLAIGGLLWLVRLVDRIARRRIEEIESKVERSSAQLREALAAYKLEVAKSYSTVGLIKDVELRLTGHLCRIEAKLDNPLHVTQQGGH